MRVLGDVVRLNAKRYPEKKALIHFISGSLTYRELNGKANQVAHGLLSLGVTKGDKVAIVAKNCLEYVALIYAIAKCGCVCVPANSRYKAEELAYVVKDSAPKVLFYGEDFSSLVDAARSAFSTPVQLIAMSGEPLEGGIRLSSLTNEAPAGEPPVHVDPLSPAFIMYTSGTTGFPKGVLFSHSVYIDVAFGMAYEGDLRHNDIMMVNLPIFHNAATNAMILPTFIVGGTCIITDGSFDPDMVLTTVNRHGVTVTMWVPTMLARLIDHPGVRDYDCSCLKKIWYGSSAISPTVMKGSLEIFKADFYQWYGQTETGMVSVLKPEDHAERSQYTGREMVNAEIRIVDEDGRDTPVGEVGEIITSRNLGMIGYYGKEEATRHAIRDGWIHTEDLARVERDGYFTIVDRLRDMIISGAENIYPKEIEDVISSHPGVEEVTAFGIPDEKWGEAVCVAVVKREGHELSQNDIIDFCASRISSYKKPKIVEFRDELPKNAAGKITKKILRDPYWAGRTRRV
jgi:fatty-acyl-CoA synthase